MIYLISGAVTGILTAAIAWGVETVQNEIRAAADRVHAEVRAGNAYDSLVRDRNSSTRLRSVKPS